MRFQIPNSINVEHDELHRDLKAVINSGGTSGEVAKVVADLLHEHFVKEEKYALPPLGLLSQLAAGNFHPEMSEAIALTDKLRAELPEMINEHKAIVIALDQLLQAGRDENKPSVIAFAERLKLHAKNEEEILYPAAILVGDYLKARMKDELLFASKTSSA